MAGYRRFVALGDSQSEGRGDLDAEGRPIGWADRFAARLAGSSSPGLTYANLATNGARTAHVVRDQLPAALAMQPDLASVVVGMNDVLRHDFDLEAVVAGLEDCFASLTAAGARVLTMTFPDVARMLPVMGWLRPREARLNAAVVDLAASYDVTVLDLFPLALCGDPEIWSPDRIHGSALGHTRIAEGMAERLGLPADAAWWRPTGTHQPVWRVALRDAWWTGTFVAPFLVRMLRGRPPTAGRVAKRPYPTPVAPDVV